MSSQYSGTYLDVVVINSTGQTAGDLLGLRALWEILQVDDNKFTSGTWLPPALTDPNYVPERQEGMKLGLTIAFLFGMLVTGMLVSFKIVTTQRGRATRMLFLEDWLLLVALISGWVVLIVSFISMYKYQAGWHIWDVRLKSAEGTFRLIMIINLLTVWTYTVTRVSLLLGIRRLYSGFRTKMQIICDILIICKLLYWVACYLALIFQVPGYPGVLFDIWASTRHKARPQIPTIGICAAGLFLDIIILLTPMPLIPKLKKLSARRKLQISIIFLCGFLTITASAARLWQIISLKDTMVTDQTYYIPLLELVNYFEVMFAIITCCLPSAKFFFRWAYNKKSFPICHDRPTETSRQGLVDMNDSQVTDMTWNSRSDWHSLYAAKAELEIIAPPTARISIHSTNTQILGIAPASTRPVSVKTGNFALLDEWEDDDDNFYDHLQPSESFFPSATGLSPRPPRR